MKPPPLMTVSGLSKRFPARAGPPVLALDRVSFTLAERETIGLVGESGCGKTTLGRCLLRLIEPGAGAIRFRGRDILDLTPRDLRRQRRHMQMVFQDPFGSINPRQRVSAMLTEPLYVHELGDRPARLARAAAMLDRVGLSAGDLDRYPHQFSGGQRQRLAIARALIVEPALLVADEPVSALDVSIQSQILNLLADLRDRADLAMILISHDLAVVRHVCDRIAVMYLGEIVEVAAAAELVTAPQHPYTKALVGSVYRLSDVGRRKRPALEGDLPDPAHRPQGCAFVTRCPAARPDCARRRPALRARATTAGSRLLACHLYAPIEGSPP